MLRNSLGSTSTQKKQKAKSHSQTSAYSSQSLFGSSDKLSVGAIVGYISRFFKFDGHKKTSLIKEAKKLAEEVSKEQWDKVSKDYSGWAIFHEILVGKITSEIDKECIEKLEALREILPKDILKAWVYAADGAGITILDSFVISEIS